MHFYDGDIVLWNTAHCTQAKCWSLISSQTKCTYWLSSYGSVITDKVKLSTETQELESLTFGRATVTHSAYNIYNSAALFHEWNAFNYQLSLCHCWCGSSRTETCDCSLPHTLQALAVVIATDPAWVVFQAIIFHHEVLDFSSQIPIVTYILHKSIILNCSLIQIN